MPQFNNEKSLMVSVVVPCRNEFKHIKLFIESVLRQKPGEMRIEVLIADGMSDDGTREILEEIIKANPVLRIIDNPERTTAFGLNHAIKAAQGDIIVRMDVHSEYADDYIRQCVSVLEQTSADNVGGPAGTKANGYFQTANKLVFHSPFAVGGARFHNVDYEGYVDTVTYGCWKKETLEKLGMFDEEFVRNQDDELNLRIIRGGGKIWQSPKIQSWYYPRSSLKALFKQYMQYGYWKVRIIQKHKIPASIRHVVPGTFVGLLIFLIFLFPFSKVSIYLFTGLLVLYAVANIIASLSVCREIKLFKYFPVIPVIFAAYHFGYGLGFLKGIFDFSFKRAKKSG